MYKFLRYIWILQDIRSVESMPDQSAFSVYLSHIRQEGELKKHYMRYTYIHSKVQTLYHLKDERRLCQLE